MLSLQEKIEIFKLPIVNLNKIDSLEKLLCADELKGERNHLRNPQQLCQYSVSDLAYFMCFVDGRRSRRGLKIVLDPQDCGT